MDTKERRSARKWFKKILAPFKDAYKPTSFELYGMFLVRSEEIEFTEREFIDFCWADDENLQKNILERHYQWFVSRFGRFSKMEYLLVRLALKV